jgi:hypothetical protein
MFRQLTTNCTNTGFPTQEGDDHEGCLLCSSVYSRSREAGTIASQLEALRSQAKEHEYEIMEEYVRCDDGYSGALLARPELDRLRDGAQAGAFDAILVLSPDRLSRKYAYLILILEEFERFGKPRSEWIAVSIPPLIDRETFDRSQAQHGPNRQFSPRNLQEERWLLRRLLRCAKCGLKCACVADKRRPHMPPSHYYRCEKKDRVWGRP